MWVSVQGLQGTRGGHSPTGKVEPLGARHGSISSMWLLNLFLNVVVEFLNVVVEFLNAFVDCVPVTGGRGHVADAYSLAR